MPAHIIQPLQLSPDFKGKIIVAAKAFMEECRPSKRPPSMTHYMRIKKNPRLTLLPEETRLLDTYIKKIREKRTHITTLIQRLSFFLYQYY